MKGRMPANLENSKRILVKKQNTPGLGESFHRNTLVITNQHIHTPKQEEFRDAPTQC